MFKDGNMAGTSLLQEVFPGAAVRGDMYHAAALISAEMPAGALQARYVRVRYPFMQTCS